MERDFYGAQKKVWRMFKKGRKQEVNEYAETQTLWIRYLEELLQKIKEYKSTQQPMKKKKVEKKQY